MRHEVGERLDEELVRRLEILLAMAEELSVPVRSMSTAVSYCGSFYGQWGGGNDYPEGITMSSLLSILDGLPDGTTELGCHPGADGLCDLESMYTVERSKERVVICDATLPGELRRRGIELCSFAGLLSAAS